MAPSSFWLRATTTAWTTEVCTPLASCGWRKKTWLGEHEVFCPTWAWSPFTWTNTPNLRYCDSACIHSFDIIRLSACVVCGSGLPRIVRPRAQRITPTRRFSPLVKDARATFVDESSYVCGVNGKKRLKKQFQSGVITLAIVCQFCYIFLLVINLKKQFLGWMRWANELNSVALCAKQTKLNPLCWNCVSLFVINWRDFLQTNKFLL